MSPALGCLALPFGLLLAGPASATPACPLASLPDRTASDLSLELDVDLDGRLDRVVVEESRGSSGGSTTVTIRLASGGHLTTEVEHALTAIVNSTPIPKELLAHQCALAVTERLAFGELQAKPDPSLAWLLATEKRLAWVAGPPALPDTSTVRIGDTWVSYLGGTHGPAREAARQGDRVLLATAHGVILTDAARTRHAWVYVSAGNERKLRWPSIRGARIEGETAVISLEPFTPGDEPATVRVDLATGRLS